MASMEKFDNVELITKANVYFDGKVVSHTFFVGGERKTMGVIYPGEYEFGTSDAEIMSMIAGTVDVMLPGSPSWEKVPNGGEFRIPADSKFRMKASEISEYVCSYIKN